jgi:ATP-dependent helicase/nuclease subunit B
MPTVGDIVSIVLVPDASAGRLVRRVIASRKLGLGLRVVTWPELVEEVRAAYLFPRADQDWVETVRQAIGQSQKGYWRRSFEVDPTGTAIVVATALEDCIRSGGIEGNWTHPSLGKRSKMVLSDLHELWAHANNALPPELELIKAVESSPERAISRFSIHMVDDWPQLDSFQAHLIDLLNKRGHSPNESLLEILQSPASLPEITASTPEPRKLSSQCFSGGGVGLALSDDIAFLLARDPLQEVEAAIGIVQSMLGQGTKPENVGILVPDEPYFQRALGDVLANTGILCAGLPSQAQLRDLGGEIVRSLILFSRGPVPKMALASMLASPIAPWSREIGLKLATDVMAGRFELKSPAGILETEERSLTTIRRLRAGGASIVDAIEVFASKLDDDIHLPRLRSLVRTIDDCLISDGSIDHEQLLQLVGHVTSTTEMRVQFPSNGIRIFRESQEPWAEVDHLIVLGFNSGRYPVLPGATPLLHDLEKQDVNEHLGWHMQTSDALLKVRRERLQRQIASASKTVKFIASARNVSGSAIQPAETTTFMAGLFGREPDDLFVPLAEDTRWLPRNHEEIAQPPRRLIAADLHLHRDILSLRTDTEGNLLPESPTSLDTLLVSPLAWLLGRIGAEPTPWEPDTLGPLLQGNIAHSVFEQLFPVGGGGVDRETVETVVDKALADAIRKHAPLLSTAQWKVERHSLRATLIQAVSCWQDVLDSVDGRVVGVEARLTGEFNGIPISGFCDEIIQLPNGKLVVVDFKKSTSGKRRERMELGYDCQVSLYEMMLGEDGSGLELETSPGRPGIVYFTLNDQRVLADDRTGLPPDVPGLAVVANDVSGHALRDIEARLKKLRLGVVEMNQGDDADRLDKENGLPGYALEASPLVMMFAHLSSGETMK